MPIAYLIQTGGVGKNQARSVYHLHLTDEPTTLCGHRRVADRNWTSTPDINAFHRTPIGRYIQHKRCCAICAALRQPYERLDHIRHRVADE
jgi:hypothetical protein